MVNSLRTVKCVKAQLQQKQVYQGNAGKVIQQSQILTQETTRPLKQGSLALSSEISSLTTLKRDVQCLISKLLIRTVMAIIRSWLDCCLIRITKLVFQFSKQNLHERLEQWLMPIHYSHPLSNSQHSPSFCCSILVGGIFKEIFYPLCACMILLNQSV